MAGLWRRRCVLIAFGVAGLTAAVPAKAGEYTVRTCNAAPTFATQAFGDFATRGMLVRRACNPEGRGARGLIIGNVRRAGRVRPRARSILAMTAPNGAHFKRYSWSGQTARSDCGYSIYSYAAGPAMKALSVASRRKKNRPAFRACPRPGRFQASGNPRPTTHVVGGDAAGANRIVHRVDCRARGGCAARGVNWVRIFKASVTVSDRTPPHVTITGGSILAQRWVAGRQTIQYAATDNVGVRAGRAVGGGLALSDESRSCDYTRIVPCPNGIGGLGVDTREFREGSQPLAVDGTDSAGNVRRSAARLIGVDNTPPARVDVAVEGGETWRRTPTFTLRWANPNEGDRAPIAAARYRLCPSSTAPCAERRVAGLGISSLQLTAPAPGEHTARMWREDQAGNQEPDNDSVPVTLRYDPEPPRPVFDQSPPADPTRVSVSVADRVSGLATGGIEMGRVGSGTWHALPTRVEGTKLVTRIDDSRYPAGQYALRARAADKAGNEASTTSRADGKPMIVTLPLRVSSRMRAGIVRRKVVRKRGRGRKGRRRVTVLAPSGRARFGRPVRIGGRLRNAQGDPISGARVLVYSRTASTAEQLVGVTATDSAGRYRFRARASSSRTFRFLYEGTGLMLPAQDEVRLSVPAASSIGVSRRRVRNGGAVTFSGRLKAPSAGKLIELQVRLSGRYQTFKTTRTGPNGEWAARYRFRRSCGVVRYAFRALIPAEAVYPFAAGSTRRVAVRVRGLPCG